MAVCWRSPRISTTRDFTHLTLFLWDTTTGKELRRGVEDARFMHEVLFSTDGRFIYSRGSDHCVRRWNADTLEAVVLTKCDDVIRFTAGGRFALLSAGLQFTLWDLDKNAAVRTLSNPTLSGINGMTGSPDGRWVASLHQDGGLHLWDTMAGKHLGELKLHTKYGPNQYLCAADGLQLVTGAEGDPLRYTRLDPERLQGQ